MIRVRTAIAALIGLCALWIGCSRSPEARRDKYMAQGREFLQKKDYSRAILDFKNAGQAMPKDPEVYYQLSLAYWGAGDVKMGITSVRKALELNPKHAQAQLWMARIMSMASDPAIVKDAQQRLEQMLTETPENVNALQLLALTEVRLGEPDSAIGHLGRAMTLMPNDVTIGLSLANAKLHENDLKGAEEILRKLVQHAPKSTDAAVLLGSFLRLQSRWPEAEQEFLRALSLSPENGQALAELANLQNTVGRRADAEQTYKRLSALPGKTFKPVHAIFLFQEGRRDEGIRELEKLFKEDPEDRQARTRLLAAYRTVNRTTDAENILDQALKKNSKDADALLQRAEMLMSSAKYDQAEVDLNRVRGLRPDSPQVHYIVAKLHQRRGETGVYRKELTEALRLDPTWLSIRLEAVQELLGSKNPKAAMGLLDEAPSTEKDLPDFLTMRNWVLSALGDLGEMRKGIDKGLASKRTPELLLQDGVWNLQTGKFAAARAALEEALKIDPANLRALDALNQSYTAQKQNGMGLQKVQEFASRAPKSAAVQQFTGSLLLANGQRQKAREAFLMAKAADPSFVLADLSMVQADIADGKMDEARRQLDKILSSNPSNPTAMLWLGNVEIAQGNHKAALEYFRKAVDADPNNTQALNNYAYVLSEYKNEPTEALKYAQKAKELSPEDGTYDDTLGWILYRKGLYPNAVSQLERVTAKGGEPVWVYHLAMAYAKAGDMKRSREALDRALKLNPNLPEAKMAQELVGATK